MKLKWILISLVLIVIVLFLLIRTGVIGDKSGIKVSAENASVRTITETVNASGKIYPEVEVKVSPDISGEIMELNVQEGDSVHYGQVLARIYADIYDTQREQAQAVVRQQEASVLNTKAQLAGLKAAMDQAKANYDRQHTLLAQKVISASEFEQAQSSWLSAEANYNAARENIRSSQASVASAKAALSRADKDLGRTTILAPMNGVVSLLAVKKGERVVGTAQMAGTEMMRIADMNSIEVQVDVPENDIPKVKLKDSAIVTVDAYSNRKFYGIVTQIASSTSTTAGTVSSSDVTNYQVHIRLDPASYKDLVGGAGRKSFPFRPGMSANADIQTNRISNILTVPINAVTIREKQASDSSATNADMSQQDEVVFVCQPDNTIKQVIVKTGIQDMNYIQILSGLKPGDKVVTGPYATVSRILKNGTVITIVPKDKLFEIKK